jgi:hypothetical protein
MRTGHRSPITPSDGGAPPPVSPFLPVLDEGPMRAELLRQIRRLEIEISRFAVANCPYDTVPGSRRRGPAILTTAQLEEIRDELLAARTALHDLVVERVTTGLHPPEPKPSRLARLGRRARKAE